MNWRPRIVLAWLAWAGPGLAVESSEPARPWTGPGTPAVPEWANSAQIMRADEPLYQAANTNSPRRGTAALGARLPIFEAMLGAGCERRWLMVGPMAWVCEDVIRFSSEPALAAGSSRPVPADGLPYRYYFVGEYGTLGYRNLATAEQGYPDAELDADFVVAIVSIKNQTVRDPFGLTTHDLWVPMRDLRPARPTLFRGVERPRDGTAWVIDEPALVYDRPGGRKVGEHPRLTQLAVLERRQRAGSSWLRVADNQWLRGAALRVRTEQPPPPGIRPRERWIDVDLEQQVLTAFEGSVPVFSSLISSGRGKGEAHDATPTGEYRIWVKLETSDMDNLENPDASRYYAIQSVPWVMYFERGYGLHGAFWHEGFGRVRSHGCVNLSPLDAKWLFDWSGPHLPAGWRAVFPTEYEQGTLVRVR